MTPRQRQPFRSSSLSLHSQSLISFHLTWASSNRTQYYIPLLFAHFVSNVTGGNLEEIFIINWKQSIWFSLQLLKPTHHFLCQTECPLQPLTPNVSNITCPWAWDNTSINNSVVYKHLDINVFVCWHSILVYMGNVIFERTFSCCHRPFCLTVL